MKYIVLKHKDGEEFLITFPNHPKMVHKHMVEAVKSIRVDCGFGQWNREFRESKVVSAGFVDSSGYCYGESMSLNIESRPDIDTELLKSQYRR